MNIETIIDCIECAISKPVKHLALNNAVKIQCGHYACEKCTEYYTKNSICEELKCKKCDNQSTINTNTQPVDLFQCLEDYFDQISAYFGIKLSETMKLLKECLIERQEKFISQINYVRDEIEIRIESLKIDLDNLNNYFQNELEKCKEEIFNVFSNQDEMINSVQELIEKLTRNEQLIDKNNFKTNEILNECQEKLNYMQQIFQDFDNYNLPVTFDICDKQIDIDLIGKLNFNYLNEQRIKNLNEKLKQCKYSLKPIKYAANEICVLPNGHLLTSNLNDLNLILYDNEFNIIKKIYRFNNSQHQSIYTFGLTTNNLNSIYICDAYHHCIQMTDLELNLMNEIGQQGSHYIDQFNFPCGLCYHNDYVFICDSLNQRIQIYNKHLAYQGTFDLNYKPFQIKFTKNSMCIRDNGENNSNFIYFYEHFNKIDQFQLKFKYGGHNGTIMQLYNYIYEYYCENKTIYIYNSNGELVETIKFDNVDNIKFNGFEAIAYFDQNFIISSENSNNLFVL